MILEKTRKFIRKFPLIKRAIEIGEGTGNAFTLAFGSSASAIAFGFIKSEPHIAMACGAIVFYYVFQGYVSLIEWLRHEDLDNTLIIVPQPAGLVQTGEEKFNIFVNFAIQNIGHNKVLVKIEKEFFSIGSICSNSSTQQSFFTLVPNGLTVQHSEPIIGVSGKSNKKALCDLSIRFGPSEKYMTHRWIVRFEILMPPQVSDDPHAVMGGMNLIESRFERVEV